MISLLYSESPSGLCAFLRRLKICLCGRVLVIYDNILSIDKSCFMVEFVLMIGEKLHETVCEQIQINQLL